MLFGDLVMVTPETPRATVPGTISWEVREALWHLRPPQPPEGVTAVTVTHYRVGPYTYTSSEHEMAQYRRQQGSK